MQKSTKILFYFHSCGTSLKVCQILSYSQCIFRKSFRTFVDVEEITIFLFFISFVRFNVVHFSQVLFDFLLPFYSSSLSMLLSEKMRKAEKLYFTLFACTGFLHLRATRISNYTVTYLFSSYFLINYIVFIPLLSIPLTLLKDQ